jgi:hypothetical protein
VVGGAVAAAAFGASPLADRLRPDGPARTTDASGGSTAGAPPDVLMVQPAGTAEPAAGGSSREAESRASAGRDGPTAASRSAQRAASASTGATPTPTVSGSASRATESPSPTSSPEPSSPEPSDPEPSDPLPLALPTLTGGSLPNLPSLPTALPTLPATLPLP